MAKQCGKFICGVLYQTHLETANVNDVASAAELFLMDCSRWFKTEFRLSYDRVRLIDHQLTKLGAWLDQAVKLYPDWIRRIEANASIIEKRDKTDKANASSYQLTETGKTVACRFLNRCGLPAARLLAPKCRRRKLENEDCMEQENPRKKLQCRPRKNTHKAKWHLFTGSADEIAKKECIELFIRTCKECDPQGKYAIIVLDWKFHTTKMLIEAGVDPDLIYVVECEDDHFVEMQEMNEENQESGNGSLAHLSHEYMSEFLCNYNGPLISGFFYDAQATLKGSDVCRPQDDLANLFKRKLTADQCCILVTLSHHSKVDTRKFHQTHCTLNDFVHEIALEQGYKTMSKGFRSYSTVSSSLFGVSKRCASKGEL